MSETNTATQEAAHQAPPDEELVAQYAEDDSDLNLPQLRFSYEAQVYQSRAVLTTRDEKRTNPRYNRAERGELSNEASLYYQDAFALGALLDAPVGAVLRARGYDSAPTDRDNPQQERVTVVPLVSALAETPITADGRYRFVAYEGEEFPVPLFMEHLAKGEVLLANRGRSAVHDALVHAPIWLLATPELLDALSAKAAGLTAMAKAAEASIDSLRAEVDSSGDPLGAEANDPGLYQRRHSAGVSLIAANDLMGRFMDQIEGYLAGSRMGARLAAMPAQHGAALMSSVSVLENQVAALLQPWSSEYEADSHREAVLAIAATMRDRVLSAA